MLSHLLAQEIQKKSYVGSKKNELNLTYIATDIPTGNSVKLTQVWLYYRSDYNSLERTQGIHCFKGGRRIPDFAYGHQYNEKGKYGKTYFKQHKERYIFTLFI